MVVAAKAATQIGIDQYRAGTIDFNRVFNLETAQVQQQDQLAIAQGNIALNLIAVYRALGGGWELREQKAAANCAGAAPRALAAPVMPATANRPATPADAYAELAPTSLTELTAKAGPGAR